MITRLLDRWRSSRKRFGTRLIAGMLAMSLPIMAVLAIVLPATKASMSSTR